MATWRFQHQRTDSFDKQRVRALLFRHIKDCLVKKHHCFVKIINGTNDHIHILFLLNHNYSVQQIFHYIKGESSHWINERNFLDSKFAWQTGYGAFSVSESKIEVVERYIAGQKEHHRIKTFTEEYDQLLEKYNIKSVNR